MIRDNDNNNNAKEDIKPYWNSECNRVQKNLWLPFEKDKILNYYTNSSEFWKKTYLPIDSIKPCFLPILDFNSNSKAEILVTSKKIRIFPKEEQNYIDLLSLSRRSYNLTVELLNAEEFVDFNKKPEIRKNIREKVKKEWENRVFSSVVSDEAVNEAFDNFFLCLAKRKKGEKAELHYRSKKNKYQTFAIQRLSKGGPLPRILGKTFVTEIVPEEAIRSIAKVTRVFGRWYLFVKQYITTYNGENQARVVALDPGVRTFITAFSPWEGVKYGEQFADNRLFPLLEKKDNLFSLRKKLLNIKTSFQWWKDRIKEVEKRLNRVSSRIDDIITDLHHRIAFDLVSNYDVIFCPYFKITEMIRKNGRVLDKKVVRKLSCLRHYEFQKHLRWMCKKYGKSFVFCNEAYTSKTQSWDGKLNERLGSSKRISDESISVDRDLNGARGILIKAVVQGSPRHIRNSNSIEGAN